MKDILTAPFVQEMMKTTANMYRLGWDERNGGNISYMLETEQVAEYLDLDNVIRTIPTGFDATDLIGKIFIVTGTGKSSFRISLTAICALTSTGGLSSRRLSASSFLTTPSS